jgi:hypothetical protein
LIFTTERWTFAELGRLNVPPNGILLTVYQIDVNGHFENKILLLYKIVKNAIRLFILTYLELKFQLDTKCSTVKMLNFGYQIKLRIIPIFDSQEQLPN